MPTQDTGGEQANQSPRPQVTPAPQPLTYASSGVDIDAKTALMKRLAPLFRSTFTERVAADIGAFGGMFSAANLPGEEPLLVASTDSVGTKVKVAALAGQHKSIGYDIVSHCVNDIVCQGAQSLFFLDYFAAGKLDPEIMTQVVEGLTAACRQAGCALIGGETAELPGCYQPGDYDLVGFVVGVIDKEKVITGAGVQPGDVLIGLASDGLHTNGYSLARKLFFEIQGCTPDTIFPELGESLGEALLRPHRMYAPALLKLIEEYDVRGIAHITGGGLPDNLPRSLAEGCLARINKASWQVPPLFQLMQRLGSISEEEMFHTFNMGIGAVVIAPVSQSQAIIKRLVELGETAFVIGEVVAGEKGVSIS
jgi:phosphoribosylformylglycinamidine cyclo-ligase